MENAARCLNCGATLVARFCSACGQRALPPHPTIAELAGDAWNELSGYDGRIAATFRGLLRPGLLTRSYIEGQRARYLSPVRLYLFVSLVYFLVAAAAPSLDENGRKSIVPGVSIEVNGTNANPGVMVTPDEREELLKNVENAPWIFRPLLRAVATRPEEFRAHLYTVMPRVFFAMLPVFAGIVFLFYRREPFPTALVFAVHIHAVAFVVLTASEATKFTRSLPVAAGAAAIASIGLATYAVMAFRAVFGGRILGTLGKLAAIGFLYAFASVPAFLIILMWASLP